MLPEVEVIDGSIITEEHRIYSSGGANSYWSLLSHLVENILTVEPPYLPLNTLQLILTGIARQLLPCSGVKKNHSDMSVKKAHVYIEENIGEKISADELADIISVGRRSFERRFKQATNNTVLEYIHRIKIEAAKRSFETSRKNINEVMFDVGYTDTKAFRTMFKKITGLTQIEYRNKYNKQTVMV